MQHPTPLTCFLALLFPLGISTQNSTFRNPIITGFHPDPSCIFVSELDDTWFCASSSFLAFPGLPIHANLVRIWPPPVAFYLMTTLVNQQLPRVNDSRWDNLLVTTEDPYSSEAWSDPIHFSFPGFDPSPFWDDDGTAYVSGAHTAAYYPGIMHAPLDFETGEIGNITMPWNGTGGSSPEGPHIFKRDGWYYGPFEPAPTNPLLTTANDTSSYFQAVGHADLFQDANGRWWAVALAVRAGGSYGEAPYFANFPLGRETGGWPVFTPVSGEVSGWPLPAEEIPEQGEGQLSDADDSAVDRLSSAGGWRMAHSLFRFRVDVDWASSLSKEEMEVGHFDLSIVLLKPSQEHNTSSAPLQPYIRFRGHSETPYRGPTSAPSEAYPLPEGWAGQKPTLQIEARVFGHCRGDELVPYYLGTF
ncbi:beta-xylosidase [Daldinia grandis]|nr:beta-xylosidase [Daldinia grandis]